MRQESDADSSPPPPAPPPAPARARADPVNLVEDGGLDVLRRLLSLPPDVAAQVRRDVPRRRAHRSQSGPSASFGDVPAS